MNGHAPSSWMPAAISVTPCLAKDCNRPLGRCREANRGPPSAKPERTNSSGCSRIYRACRARSSPSKCRDRCWIRDHLPGHVAQTAATRAFNAILQYAFDKPGRPKFRRRDRFNSFESKEAKSTIMAGRRRADRRASDSAIRDPANASQSEALKAKTKHCGTETSAVALRSERVRSKNIMPITASRGWRGARRHASVESPRER
jgi:hypothetical protein